MVLVIKDQNKNIVDIKVVLYYNMYYHYIIDHDLDDLEVGIYVNR